MHMSAGTEVTGTTIEPRAADPDGWGLRGAGLVGCSRAPACWCAGRHQFLPGLPSPTLTLDEHSPLRG